MKKTILISVIGLVIVSAFAFYIFNEKDNVTAKVVYKEPLQNIKIGYREHLFYLPAYVAYAKGYYKEQGLDAELVKFSSTNQLVEAIINRNIDAGIGGINAEVVLTIETKTPGMLKIFSLGIYNEQFDGLLVAKNSNIIEIKDLENKTISAIPGSSSMITMNKMIEKEGLKGKVKIVQTEPSQQLNALSSGSVDAIFVLEPLVTIAEEKGIGRVLIESPITNYLIPDNMPYVISVFSADFVSENPELAEKIVKAADKAIEFVNKNPEEAKLYYSDFTPISNETEAKLPIATYQLSGALNMASFQEVADKLFESGVLEKNVPAQTMFIK